MKLCGEKVTLREMRPDEFGLFYSWAAESVGGKFWYGDQCGEPVPSKEKFAEEYAPHYFDGGAPELGRCFVIETGGRLIGEVNYNKIDRSDNSTELDILIADEADMSHGYGTEAMRLLMEYLHGSMGIERFTLEVLSKNSRAIKSYFKNGFRKIGEKIENGVYYDLMEQTAPR